MSKVSFRKMEFPFSKTGFEKYWHGGSPFITFFFNALSSAFPPGEVFFCETVRRYRERVESEELQQSIDQFIHQELHHVLHHRNFNRMVAKQGFNIKKAEKRNADFLKHVRDNYKPEDQLAFTLAFEHFTAALADQILTNDRLLKPADPNVAALWLWHAAEETEHKSVAFEVFDAIEGSYWSRVKVYLLAFYKLFSIAFLNQFEMLRDDGSFSIGDTYRGLRFLLGKGGLLRGVFRSLLDYLKPSFRPDEVDNYHLTEKWEQENQDKILSKAS